MASSTALAGVVSVLPVFLVDITPAEEATNLDRVVLTPDVAPARKNVACYAEAITPDAAFNDSGANLSRPFKLHFAVSDASGAKAIEVGDTVENIRQKSTNLLIERGPLKVLTVQAFVYGLANDHIAVICGNEEQG